MGTALNPATGVISYTLLTVLIIHELIFVALGLMME